MALQVSESNNVKVYTVSGGNISKAIPDWLARKRKKVLKNDVGMRI
jgi:ribosome biogenesis protein ENP2